MKKSFITSGSGTVSSSVDSDEIAHNVAISRLARLSI